MQSNISHSRIRRTIYRKDDNIMGLNSHRQQRTVDVNAFSCYFFLFHFISFLKWSSALILFDVINHVIFRCFHFFSYSYHTHTNFSLQASVYLFSIFVSAREHNKDTGRRIWPPPRARRNLHLRSFVCFDAAAAAVLLLLRVSCAM